MSHHRRTQTLIGLALVIAAGVAASWVSSSVGADCPAHFWVRDDADPPVAFDAPNGDAIELGAWTVTRDRGLLKVREVRVPASPIDRAVAWIRGVQPVSGIARLEGVTSDTRTSGWREFVLSEATLVLLERGAPDASLAGIWVDDAGCSDMSLLPDGRFSWRGVPDPSLRWARFRDVIVVFHSKSTAASMIPCALGLILDPDERGARTMTNRRFLRSQ